MSARRTGEFDQMARLVRELQIDDEDADPVVEAVRDHSGPDAVRTQAHPPERDAEEDERRQRAGDPVAQTEDEPGDDHGGDSPEEAEGADAEPAEEELLSEGDERAHDQGVQREGAGVLRLPCLRREPLVAASVEDRLEGAREEQDQDDEPDGDADPAPLEGADPDRLERALIGERDEEGHADEEGVDDDRPDREAI